MGRMLARRLAVLAARPPRRCATCRDWGPRVCYPPGSPEAGRREQPPARCPFCGYEPLTIVITYVDPPLRT